MEAADTPSASSKVIVQCSDPYGLFDKILPDLQAHQPLGNLHWKSSTRPLRSIKTLNVSFTKEDKQSEDSGAKRRHQIPGLRQTPFVKILLLRCDDKEIYKESVRRDVKQWLKSQGLPSEGKNSSKGQERHDAFEYIILHVVLPNTAAAGQPKSSKHLVVDPNESTDSINSKSKWTGKTSSTIYDKLRADFSSSSKAPFERVAQVRVVEPGTKTSPGMSPAEHTELWQDFIEKLKAAILGSFDLRVAQYEDDIRDRDSQRNLPGWNFCTFFILKEGLARGFENVGLLDDALTVYNELDAGLDDIVRLQNSQSDIDSAGALLPFSNDLKPAIRDALNALKDETVNSKDSSTELEFSDLIDLEQKNFPFDLVKLDYQQRILTNKVSALDLRSYIFTRKLRLLFRKARVSASPSRGSSKKEHSEMKYDIASIADITEQALAFVSLGARALGQDLYVAWGGREGLSQSELDTQEHVINNLVVSWKFSALIQIFRDCRLAELLPENLLDTEESNLSLNGKATGDDASLEALSKNSEARKALETPTELQFKNQELERQPSTMISLQQPQQSRSLAPQFDARERLALWTGELLVRARLIVSTNNPAIENLCITNADGEEQSETELDGHRLAGLQSSTLKLVLSSTQTCLALFKRLTICAYRCYAFAKQIQASRQMLLSLAQLGLSDDSPELAAKWLENIPDLTNLHVQTITDLAVLATYRKSLGRQRRLRDLSKCLVAILKACTSGIGSLAITKLGINIQDTLEEMQSVSQEVESSTLPLEQFFTIHHIDKSIHHRDRKDGFAVSLSISLRLQALLRVERSMTMKISAAQQNDPKVITLTTKNPCTITFDKSDIIFEGSVTTFGWFNFDSLSIRIGNVSFKHEFNPQVSGDLGRRAVVSTPWPIMLYPRAGALSVKIYPAPDIDLTQVRRMRVGVGAGDHDMHEVSIRLKPATAGIRLNIQAAKLYDGIGVEHFDVVMLDNANTVQLRNLQHQHAIIFDVPYTTENATLSVMEVKFEISYKTSDGAYEAFFTESMNPILPVTVNVQDIFQSAALFSRFTAGPATAVPIKIMNWEIEDNEAFEVEESGRVYKAEQTFPKLSTSWITRIKRKEKQSNTSNKMPLVVKYQCLDDLVLHVIEARFITDIGNGPLVSASPLLVKHLVDRIPKLWNESELEAIGLLQEIRLWSYEEMSWKDVLRALDGKVRTEAEKWLRMWHQQYEYIDLSTAQTFTRTLRLPVDVPQPSLVISTQYRFSSNPITNVTIGEPIKAEVVICCQRNTDEEIEIQYEISGLSEMWLVGGRKRGILSASINEVSSTVLLIAQRAGHLLLPSIDIRVRRTTEVSGSSVPSFEVEHKSQAQSVLAIPAVQSTTIVLGVDSASGGYIVDGSQQRLPIPG